MASKRSQISTSEHERLTVDLEEARRLYDAGRYQDAEQICRALLLEGGDRAEALHMLGRIMYRLGRLEMSEAMCRRALTFAPSSPDILLTLGQVLYSTAKVPEAVDVLEQALDTSPDNVEAHAVLGAALQELGRFEEAVHHCRLAVSLDLEHARSYFHLANALCALGKVDEARIAFSKALELDRSYGDAHRRLALALVAVHRLDEARRLLQAAAAIDPDDPEVEFALASLEGRAVERAPEKYVSSYFDRYAQDFDAHLRNVLRYRAPELVVEAAKRHLDEGARSLEVLDAGCGTGLCGPLLRPLAHRLVGVDLSAGMLQVAQKRGLYDELVQAELTECLANSQDAYDLVVAADVLVYFGDLLPLLCAARGALRMGGIMAASLERSDTEGYLLLPTGRYAHSERYVQDVSRMAGLSLVELFDCELRLEGGEPVIGLIVVLRA